MSVPVHDSVLHDPTARGRELGGARRAEVHTSWGGYERLFAVSGAADGQVREVAERTLERTHRWAPELAAEIAGIADGAGLELWQVAALNARTEVLAAIHAAGRAAGPAGAGRGQVAGSGPGAAARGECSTFVVAPPAGGPPRTIQTWDWYDHLRGNVLAWRLQPRPGRSVRVFTEFGVVGKIGVNDAGLGLHFNILGHVRDGGGPGVPVHVLARRILDEASTVEEAAALARSAPVSASTVLTVVAHDRARDRATARCLELSPAGVAEIAPDGEGVLLHTNHFLDPRLADGEQMARDDASTYGRVQELRRRAPRLLAAADPVERAQALLAHAADEEPPLCCHPAADAPLDQRWETLMTIAIDVPGARLHLHAGGPCTAGEDDWLVV